MTDKTDKAQERIKELEAALKIAMEVLEEEGIAVEEVDAALGVVR